MQGLSNPFMTSASMMGPVNGPQMQRPQVMPNPQPMMAQQPQQPQQPGPQLPPMQGMQPQQHEALLQMLAHIHPNTLKSILDQRRTAALSPPQAPIM